MCSQGFLGTVTLQMTSSQEWLHVDCSGDDPLYVWAALHSGWRTLAWPCCEDAGAETPRPKYRASLCAGHSPRRGAGPGAGLGWRHSQGLPGGTAVRPLWELLCPQGRTPPSLPPSLRLPPRAPSSQVSSLKGGSLEEMTPMPAVLCSGCTARRQARICKGSALPREPGQVLRCPVMKKRRWEMNLKTLLFQDGDSR